MTFHDEYNGYLTKVEQNLNDLLPLHDHNVPPETQPPKLLIEAMRYSLLGGGKRIRPVMLLATAKMLGCSDEFALTLASALEMIHTYSLIHDDLPCMDNDSMRRGRPTNHMVYGEGQAMLAGDGLLSYAYDIMLKGAIADKDRIVSRLLAVNQISFAAGINGMVAGQCMDLDCQVLVGSLASMGEIRLDYIDRHKTGALLMAPVLAACELAQADDNTKLKLTNYSKALGKLFQVVDDILDVTGNEKALGKSLGKDVRDLKLTCVSLLGLDGAKNFAQKLYDEAVEALDGIGCDATFLMGLAHMAFRRSN